MDTTSDSTNTSVLVRKLHERAEGFYLLTTKRNYTRDRNIPISLDLNLYLVQ